MNEAVARVSLASMSNERRRTLYPSDISDEEWAIEAPYLALVREDAPQRTHDLREVFNTLRWIVRTGFPWRYLPNDLPPWERSFAWAARFRRLAKDYERLPGTLAGPRFIACAVLVPARAAPLIARL